MCIDDHIGLAAAGYIPDARTQVDHARFFAQSNRLIYDEVVDVEGVAKNSLIWLNSIPNMLEPGHSALH